LPLAVGIALANHGVKVIVVGGDGDGYGEGLNHFIQTIRMNPNVTYIVHNNQLYSLTKGQASPTTSHGAITDSTPFGSTDEPLNPLAMAVAANCGYIARGFAGDVKHLKELMVGALKYKGFSYIDVFQPCVTFNHLNTYAWFFQRVQKLEETKHDTSDRLAAWKQATSIDTNLERLPIGLFYSIQKPTYEDQLEVLKAGPLVKQQFGPPDIQSLISTFQ
jgi:2-oxoglutarate ferredoxin oxidoreductase subunit beta